MQVDNATVLRLQVLAEADPGALVRTLQFLQARNIVPQQVSMKRVRGDLFDIAIDVDTASCGPEALSVIAAKLNELPIVLEAVVCDLQFARWAERGTYI